MNRYSFNGWDLLAAFVCGAGVAAFFLTGQL